MYFWILNMNIKNFINKLKLTEGLTYDVNYIKKNKFENCSYRNLSGGIVAIHSGWKI